MKLSINKTIELNEVSLEVEILNDADFSDVINQIALNTIDYIIQRTESGLNVRGNSFKEYPESYKKSESFEAFSKSSGDVNLTLEGNMLNSINTIEASGNYFKVGFTDELNTLKAYNHNTGDTVRKREFFGINKKEMNEILSEYQYIIDDSNAQKAIKDSVLEALLGSKKISSIIDKITSSLFDDD